MLSWIIVEEVVPIRVKAAIVGSLKPADKYKATASPKSLEINESTWAMVLTRVLNSVREVYPWLATKRDPKEHVKTHSKNFRELATRLIAEVMAPQESVTAALSRALRDANLCPIETFRSNLVPSKLPGCTTDSWTAVLRATLAGLKLPIVNVEQYSTQTFNMTMADVITAFTAMLPPPD